MSSKIVESLEKDHNSDDERERNAEIFAAIKTGDLQTVQKLLKSGVKTNIVDKNNKFNTLLHYAVEKNKQEIVEELLLQEWRLDINAKNENGDTPLHIGTKGNKELVQLLLNKHPKIELENNEGKTPLNLAKSLDPSVHSDKQSIVGMLEDVQQIVGKDNSSNFIKETLDHQNYKVWLTAEDIAVIAKVQFGWHEENSDVIFEVIGSVEQLNIKLKCCEKEKTPLDKRSLTFIVNLNQMHWVTLLICCHKTQISAFYIDPMGEAIPQEYRDALESRMQGIKIIDFQFEQQKDDFNCGVFALENARIINAEIVSGQIEQIDRRLKNYKPTSADLNSTRREFAVALQKPKNIGLKLTKMYYQPMEVDQNTVSRKRNHCFEDKNNAIQNKRERISILERSQKYAASGLKNTLHGNVYQIKLLMLFLKRGLDKGYSFRLATEMDAAEKFDDLVFQYENDSKDGLVYRFLQAKHKQDESKKITISDLLNEKDGEFSLQKYFISYRRIKQNQEFKGRNDEIKDFVICTNIDLDDSLLDDFEQLGNADNILDTPVNSKKSKCLKLKIDNFSKREKLISILESTSDLDRLAKNLAECIFNEKAINLADHLFKSYHSALKEKRIVDIENKKLHSDFIEDNNLSQEVQEFREIFREQAVIIEKSQQKNLDVWSELKSKKLKLSDNFGKIFQLNTNPQITDMTKFAKIITNSIPQQGNVISIKREVTKTGTIKDNIDKLAGHVLVFEDEGKNRKIKFSSAFLDVADTTMMGNLKDFKGILKAELSSKNINFDQLGQYEFKINEFKTCVDGQQCSQNTLTNDAVTKNDINKFFDELVFAVDQPNEIQLGEIIKKELGVEFNNIDCKNIYSRFLERMLDWMKEKDGSFYSYEEGKSFFEEIKKEILGAVWFDVRDPVELFTGRERELKSLHSSLQAGNTEVVVQTAISGLGGIGKSELSRKYANTYKDEYNNNVIWINAERYETMVDSFYKLARDNRVGIPTKDKDGKAKSIESLVAEIYRFFAKRKSLFIFDDAEMYRTEKEKDDGIDKFLPLTSGNDNHHFLITSRSQKWRGCMTVVRLGTFTEEDSIDFLKKSLGITSTLHHREIKKLAEVLQHFPLALQQAVAYIREENENCKSLSNDGKFDIKDYLEKHKEKAKDLLKFSFPEDSSNPYNKTTFITWRITLEKIRKNKECGKTAIDILNIMAYLAHNDIPVEIFFGCDSGSILLLNKYSMIDLEKGQANIHKLVQQVTRLELKEKTETVIKKVFDSLIQSFPYDEGKEKSEDCARKKQLLPHFEVFLIHIDDWIAKNPENKRKIEEDYLEFLLGRMSHGYIDLGNHRRARDLLERSLEIKEKHYGSDHFEVGKTLNNLSNAYGALGDIKKKKELLERALKMLEEYYGSDHFEVANVLNNLGNAYGDSGDIKKNKELLERALIIIEEHYGSDHFEVGRTLNNLGNAYGALGDIQKKKELLERALKIQEGHFGTDHFEVAKPLINLGTVYGTLGDTEKKKELLERALKVQKKHYGSDHFEVGRTLNNLSNAYGTLGDTKKKKELLERALKILEEQYGPDHFEVGKTLNNLGNAYGTLGDTKKKKDLLERALKINEEHYGSDHFEVVTTLGNLGRVYIDLGDSKKSKEFLERAVEIREKHYGSDHFKVASTLNSLGYAYIDAGDPKKSKEFLERAVEIQERHYGSDHIEVATTLNNLGHAYIDLGDPKKSKEFLERAVEIKEKHYGSDHFKVASTLNNLGHAYIDLCDPKKSKELLERALKIQERHYGFDHIDIATTLNNLGRVYIDLGDPKKSKELLARALEIQERHYGTDHLKIAKTLYNLGNAHGNLGDSEKQKELQERAFKIKEIHFRAF